LDPNKEVERLEKKLPRSFVEEFTDSISKSEGWDDAEKEDARRLLRMEEIWEQANNARVARCERKMAEVGRDRFMELIHGWAEDGKTWSDYEGRTEIEKEYWRLWKEQHDLEWFREHGKPYDIKDDPQAKFGPELTKEHMEALTKKMEYHYYGPRLDKKEDGDEDVPSDR
jgi:hypothetical protein